MRGSPKSGLWVELGEGQYIPQRPSLRAKGHAHITHMCVQVHRPPPGCHGPRQVSTMSSESHLIPAVHSNWGHSDEPDVRPTDVRRWVTRSSAPSKDVSWSQKNGTYSRFSWAHAGAAGL